MLSRAWMKQVDRRVLCLSCTTPCMPRACFAHLIGWRNMFCGIFQVFYLAPGSVLVKDNCHVFQRHKRRLWKACFPLEHPANISTIRRARTRLIRSPSKLPWFDVRWNFSFEHWLMCGAEICEGNMKNERAFSNSLWNRIWCAAYSGMGQLMRGYGNEETHTGLPEKIAKVIGNKVLEEGAKKRRERRTMPRVRQYDDRVTVR